MAPTQTPNPGTARTNQTELSRYVESKWRVSGKSQEEFVKELLGDSDAEKFGSQTLSKFIRGRLAAVPAGLIDGLARSYGKSAKQLESMAITPAKTQLIRNVAVSLNEDGPELHFVMGHTVWAASFLITMLETSRRAAEPRIKLATRITDDGESDLEWISHDADPTSPNVGGYRPLSAPDVITVMEDHLSEGNGGDIVTFGILPWGIVEEREALNQSQGHYIRLATLMDSATACSIIVPAEAKIDHSGPSGNNVRTSGAVVRWLSNNDRERKIILGEQGTVAGEQAHRIAVLAEDRARLDRETKKDSQNAGEHEVEIVWEHCSTNELQNSDWTALAKKHPGLAAIVAWDPQATAFVHRSVEHKVRRYSLVDVNGRLGAPDHVTFDICLFVHDTSLTAPEYGPWRTSVEKAAQRLFYDILPAIQRKQLSLVNLTRASRDTIEVLERYFGFDILTPKLSSQEISRIFSNIRYSVSVDPSGMAEALNIAQPNRSE